MVDLVLNHVSSQHEWFARYLRGEPKYRDYFIEPGGDFDMSHVRRPRATPLLTPFETPDGRQVHVWTTFGPDQIDLNYREPRVLLEAMRVLLTHVRRDAYLVRLDAVGFVWKASGTESIHEPGAHTIVRLFRHVLDVAAPDVRLVAETNVPHVENVTYLGSGDREAQLVYNFALPPLLVHAMQTGDATTLSTWARTLRVPLPSASFLNFTASHDGIGVTPVRGILGDDAIDAMIARVEENGGLVSYRARSDGTHEPYELNVAYVDALTGPGASDGERAARFLVTQAIALAMQGVPGIYLHSLLGSRATASPAPATTGRSTARSSCSTGTARTRCGSPTCSTPRRCAGWCTARWCGCCASAARTPPSTRARRRRCSTSRRACSPSSGGRSTRSSGSSRCTTSRPARRR
jgi:sucrose phosphorylase